MTSSHTLKILNLYCGIGGNRKLWNGDIEVTAVENNAKIAAIYQKNYPQDKVIICDAHKYLLHHYKNFDFIWSSRPCTSHSDIRRMAAQGGCYPPIYPDMCLYEEIIFLQHYCKTKWVVENVIPYYKPLIPAQRLGRHLFWCNFLITNSKKCGTIIRDISSSTTVYGFNISKEKLDTRKDSILRNCVNPEIALHIFQCAFQPKQKKLNEVVCDSSQQ